MTTHHDYVDYLKDQADANRERSETLADSDDAHVDRLLPEQFEIKDNGYREEFSTGSWRDVRSGKGRYDLISPIAEARLARLLEGGAVKYGERNWERGQPLSRFLDSARRHLARYLEGHRDEDHLAAAAWNVQGMIHVEEMVKRGLLPAELADLPSYLPLAAVSAPALPFIVSVRIHHVDDGGTIISAYWHSSTINPGTREQALLLAESFRRERGCEVKVTQGSEIVAIALPGDPPLAELGDA